MLALLRLGKFVFSKTFYDFKLSEYNMAKAKYIELFFYKVRYYTMGVDGPVYPSFCGM